MARSCAEEILSESLCLAVDTEAWKKNSTIGIVSTRGCNTTVLADSRGIPASCGVLCEEDVSLILSQSHEYAWTSVEGELESSK